MKLQRFLIIILIIFSAHCIYGQTKYIVRQRPTSSSGLQEGPVRKKKSVTPKKSVPDVEKWTDLGDDYYFGQDGKTQDYVEAAKWYRKAAEKGYAKAQHYLGYMYAEGQGVTQDYDRALIWYRRAAGQGYPASQTNIGYLYEYGHGVTQNYAEAVKWYRKSAEQGHARAQCNLGLAYDNGRGVSQDYAEAVKWYRKSAEQGFDIAQIIGK